MSNTGKENIHSEKILTQSNEEHPTTVEIDEISDLNVNINNAQINVPVNIECSNDDLNKKNVVLNLDIELENVMKKSNELEQKCTVFQLVENDRKTPSIWVQYNRIYSKRSPRRQLEGGQRGFFLDYDFAECRNYFVKTVFIVLFILLLLTVTFLVIVLYRDSSRKFYFNANAYLIIASMVVLVGMTYVMACSACASHPPCNFVSLLIVVIAMSNLIGAITVRYETNILVLALFSTIITVFLLMLLACSSFDFTTWYIYVILIVMVFVAISIVTYSPILLIDFQIPILGIVLISMSTLIQVVLFIIELQMILGGRSIVIEENNYALATYMLYTSIFSIFLQIVQLTGFMDE